MRLWHEALIPKLPRQQLLGQHRECCALRGAGWGKPHSTVNYVFEHPKEWLYCYHVKVMIEMFNRGYHPGLEWLDIAYQGKNLPRKIYTREQAIEIDQINTKFHTKVYPEHDDKYLEECITNLRSKGIRIERTA